MRFAGVRIPPRLRSPWFIGIASVAVVLLAVVLVWFEPQAALFDDEVNDSLPTAASVSDPTSFVSIEHDTSGALVIAVNGDERFSPRGPGDHERPRPARVPVGQPVRR